MFCMFCLTLELSNKQQKELSKFTNGFLELHMAPSNQNKPRHKFPREVNEFCCILIDRGHSVKEMFPAQKVVEIQNHARVGLKKTIHHAATHGAELNFHSIHIRGQ